MTTENERGDKVLVTIREVEQDTRPVMVRYDRLAEFEAKADAEHARFMERVRQAVAPSTWKLVADMEGWEVIRFLEREKPQDALREADARLKASTQRLSELMDEVPELLDVLSELCEAVRDTRRIKRKLKRASA